MPGQEFPTLTIELIISPLRCFLFQQKARRSGLDFIRSSLAESRCSLPAPVRGHTAPAATASPFPGDADGRCVDTCCDRSPSNWLLLIKTVVAAVAPPAAAGVHIADPVPPNFAALPSNQKYLPNYAQSSNQRSVVRLSLSPVQNSIV